MDMIIMEFMACGSLDRYLIANRHIHVRQLFAFAQNIIDGMDYLASNNIIHRDLAARNILVADGQDLVKISDFGLARRIKQSPYVMSSALCIPVLWVALECLNQNQYSFASDIWSFGVTLYELFTYGDKPFLPGCQNFFQVNLCSTNLCKGVGLWSCSLKTQEPLMGNGVGKVGGPNQVGILVRN